MLPEQMPQPFFHRLTPTLKEGEGVWIFGVVTAVRKSKNVVFFDVRHALGVTQVVADKQKSEQVWEQTRTLKRGHRVKVSGILGTTQSGAKSIFLSAPPITKESFIAETLAETEDDYQSIGASILMSQTRFAAEQFLDRENYRRIDPRYLSVDWHVDHGMIPLKVSYSGFGIPVYLAPSPAHQLLSILVATGDDRVYCSATSFTTSYRQPSDGVETGIIMAKTLGIGLNELIDHSTRLINAVCEKLRGIEGQNLRLEKCERPLSDLVSVDDPANKVWIHPPDKFGVQPFRVVLDEGITPVEGCIEGERGDLPLGTLVFHVERILPLCKHVPLRRLQHLGPKKPNIDP